MLEMYLKKFAYSLYSVSEGSFDFPFPLCLRLARCTAPKHYVSLFITLNEMAQLRIKNPTYHFFFALFQPFTSQFRSFARLYISKVLDNTFYQFVFAVKLHLFYMWCSASISISVKICFQRCHIAAFLVHTASDRHRFVGEHYGVSS